MTMKTFELQHSKIIVHINAVTSILQSYHYTYKYFSYKVLAIVFYRNEVFVLVFCRSGVFLVVFSKSKVCHYKQILVHGRILS